MQAHCLLSRRRRRRLAPVAAAAAAAPDRNIWNILLFLTFLKYFGYILLRLRHFLLWLLLLVVDTFLFLVFGFFVWCTSHICLSARSAPGSLGGLIPLGRGDSLSYYMFFCLLKVFGPVSLAHFLSHQGYVPQPPHRMILLKGFQAGVVNALWPSAAAPPAAAAAAPGGVFF